jgi:hypothetical protein
MPHERPISRATQPAENTIAQNLHFSDLVETFEDLKARKVTFH